MPVKHSAARRRYRILFFTLVALCAFVPYLPPTSADAHKRVPTTQTRHLPPTSADAHKRVPTTQTRHLSPDTVRAQPQRQVRQPPATLCAGVTVIPTEECSALLALYAATNGDTWRTSTNWLTVTETISPCDWYGVVCADGHVVQVNLADNQLTGTLPRAIGNFAALTELRLEQNQLRGNVPVTVCALTDSVTSASFAYNGLTTGKTNTRTCLDTLDPDWQQTQTVPPTDIQVSAIQTDTIQLTWTPISYTADGGYYEVRYATASDGPYTLHGQTTDKAATGYLVDGLMPGTTYYMQIRSFTPAHAEQSADFWSREARSIAVTRASERVLVLVYFPADNDLSPYIPGVTERLRQGTTLNPNAQVVLLTDGRADGDTTLVTITAGSVTPTGAIAERWGTDELDTSDPTILAWFLEYARTTYPADREIVVLGGHGVALVPELAWPEAGATVTSATPQGNLPPLPRGMAATPGDVTNNGYMSTIDLGQALNSATVAGTEPFDILLFDQCFQGNLDTLYEVHQAADIFIASPNYAWLSAPYDRYLTQFAPVSSNAAIAQSIIARYHGTLDEAHPNAIFWVRGSDIPQLATAVSNLGAALQQATAAGVTDPILNAARSSQYVDTTQCGPQRFSLGPPDELVGAGSFATRLQQGFGAGDSYGVHAAADALLTLLADVRTQSSFITGSPHIAPDETWNYRDTITILAPLRRNSPSGVAWRASVYREATPFTATWSPVPTQTVTVTAPFAYVRDGDWDDFLADWYGDALTPTVGQWCHYIPPTLVTDEATEELALRITEVSDTAIQLDWTATSVEGATAYWIYRQDPVAVSWVLQEIVPLEQTSTPVTDLSTGERYHYRVVARNQEDAAVARSDAAVWVAGRGLPVYLPFIQR
jgi:hypothetical protein